MRIKFVYAAIAFLLSSLCNGQPLPGGMHRLKKDTFEYSLIVPSGYNGQNKYPLVMYLHGYTEKTDIPWFNNQIQALSPGFVFVPKCKDSWGASAWGGTYDAELRPAMQMALSILDSLKNAYNIDTNRITVYGGSMGGEGVFMLLAKKPGYFAGAIAVAGYTLVKDVKQMCRTPFWIMHGSSDDVNPFSSSQNIYNAILKEGGTKARFTIFKGDNHSTIWGKVMKEPGIVPWLMAQGIENDSLPPDSVKNLSGIQEGKSVSLTWDSISEANNLGKRIWYYKIYRNDKLIAELDGSYHKYVDYNLETNQAYSYNIIAVNNYFTESVFSATITLNYLPVHIGEPVKLQTGLRVFPNPANTSVEIISETPMEAITLYNCTGKLVLRCNKNKQEQIDVSGLPKGLYFIHATSKEDTVSFAQFIKL